MIISILYAPLICVGHIPVGFLVIEIQYKMCQLQLRFWSSLLIYLKLDFYKVIKS